MISVLGTEKLTLTEIEAFLSALESVRFALCSCAEVYGWVERLLCQQQYASQGRRARALLRAYVPGMTGLEPGADHPADWRLFEDLPDRAQPSRRPRFRRR